MYRCETEQYENRERCVLEAGHAGEHQFDLVDRAPQQKPPKPTGQGTLADPFYVVVSGGVQLTHVLSGDLAAGVLLPTLGRIEAKVDTLLARDGLDPAERLELDMLRAKLATSAADLKDSVDRQQQRTAHAATAMAAQPTEGSTMPPLAPEFDALNSQVNTTVGVEQSAKTLIDGFQARLQAGIDAALAAGATPEALAVLQGDSDALKASSDQLAASVAANQ